ncbi:conserved Plasmodium protein, unknown function [Plasmodium knowlesi strain H]|uniref:Uncharacterized protein n=3 Tax=Plasmodium knowlesi TaxID=5850 RepID=A0A5K1VIG8_PLAKH|nr:conserved Plasmodium protein, unknown function [Plasmodium knowlesi strain H]OTN65226.1 Uncharacterized protein PKNOH_S120154900 [Plasmodium knowlesi]CAA9988405.1 conserved Plasmodium protein, unknown function [Plasmodium knowlesi strain H]SBO19918.1 conserved Plasmodium protein, unknown function [Plasmodium knowlesi strain H]SBO20380.1 conserved Plasmodium protein, unknown function [Plasmodium knowlesi strain H]VVS77879.1 conserved Plasmodium protein, unknown function [Plasmodium knowlesi |eukprot:XP_002259386.1 hypothetical protein, conserved in Plasmodium species [Plasmodium knowlesi strain H]
MSSQYEFGFYENTMKRQLRDYETHSDISCKIGYSDSESEGVASIKDVPYYAYNHNLNNSKKEKLEKPVWKSIYDIEETTKNSFSDYEYNRNGQCDSGVESPRFGNTSGEEDTEEQFHQNEGEESYAEEDEDDEDMEGGKIGKMAPMRKVNQMEDTEEDEWGKEQIKAASHPQKLYPLRKEGDQIGSLPFRQSYGNFLNEGTHIANHLSYDFRKEFENNMYNNLSAFKSTQNKYSVDEGDDASRHFLKPKTFKDSNGLFDDLGEEKLDIDFLRREHEKLMKEGASVKAENTGKETNVKNWTNTINAVSVAKRSNGSTTPGQSFHNPDGAKQKSKQNVIKLKKNNTHQYVENSVDRNSTLSSGNSTSDTYEQDFVGKGKVHFKSEQMDKEGAADWGNPIGGEDDNHEEDEEEEVDEEEENDEEEEDDDGEEDDDEADDDAEEEEEEVSDEMEDNTDDAFAHQAKTADHPVRKQERGHPNTREKNITYKKNTGEGDDTDQKKGGSTPSRRDAERENTPLKGGEDDDRMKELIAKQMKFQWWKVHEKTTSPKDVAMSQEGNEDKGNEDEGNEDEGSEDKGKILNRYEIPKDISYYVERYQRRKDGNTSGKSDETMKDGKEGKGELIEEDFIDGKTNPRSYISKGNFKVEEMYYKNHEKVSSYPFLSEQFGGVHNGGDADDTGEATGEAPQNGDVLSQGSFVASSPTDGIKKVVHNNEIEEGVFEIFNPTKEQYSNKSSTKGKEVHTGVDIRGGGSSCDYFFYDDKTGERIILQASPEGNLNRENYITDGNSPSMDEIYDKINAHFGEHMNRNNYMQIKAEDIHSGNKNIRPSKMGSQNGQFLEGEKKKKMDIFLNYLKCIDGDSLNKAFQYFVENENDESVKKQLEICLMGKEKERTANKGTLTDAQTSTLVVSNQDTQTVSASLKNEQIQTNSKGDNMEDNFMQTDIKDVNTKLYVKNEMINKKTSVDSIFFRSLSRDDKNNPKSDAENGEEVIQFETSEKKKDKDPSHDEHNPADNNISREEYNELKKINELKEKILEKIKNCYDNMSENNDEEAAILMLHDRKEGNNLWSSNGMDKSSNGYDERSKNCSAKGKKKKRSKGVLTMETLESMKSFEKEMNLLKSHNERLKRRIEKLYGEKEKLKSDYAKMEKIKESQDSLFLATEKHIEKLHDQLDNLSRQNENMKGDLKQKNIQIIALESQIDLDDASGNNNEREDSMEEFVQQKICKPSGDKTKNKQPLLELNRQLDNFKGQITDKNIIKEQINQMQKQLHNLKDDIKMMESLKMENEKLKKLLSRKNSNLNEYEKNIDKLERNIGILNDHNFDLRKENTKLSANMMALSRCDETITDAFDPAQKVTRSDGKEAYNGQEIIDRENKIRDLESHVDKLKQTIFDLKEEIFDLKEKNVELKKSAMLHNTDDIQTVQSEAEKIYVDKINMLKGKLEESKTKINMLNGLLKTSNNQTTQLNKKVRTILKENKAWQKKYEKCLIYLESLKEKYDEEVLKIQRGKASFVGGASREASASPLCSGGRWIKEQNGQNALNTNASIKQNPPKCFQGEIHPDEEVPLEEEKKGEMEHVNSADAKGNCPGRMDSHIRRTLNHKDEEKENENVGKWYNVSKNKGAESDGNLFLPLGENSKASFNLVQNENNEVSINDIFEIDNITKDIHRMFSDNEESLHVNGENGSYFTERDTHHYTEKVMKAEHKGRREGILKSIEKIYVANRIKEMNEDIHKYIIQRKEKMDKQYGTNLLHKGDTQNKGNTQGDCSQGDYTNLSLKGKEHLDDVTQDDCTTTEQVYYPYEIPQLTQRNPTADKISFTDTHVVRGTEESYLLNNHLRAGNETNISHSGEFPNVSNNSMQKSEKNLRSVFRYKINGDEEDVQIGNYMGGNYPQSNNGTKSRIDKTQKSGMNELRNSKFGNQIMDEIYTKENLNRFPTVSRHNTLVDDNESTMNHLNSLRYNPYERNNVSCGITTDVRKLDIPREDIRNNNPNSNDKPKDEPNGKDENIKNRKSEAWIIDIKNNEVFPYRKLQNTLLTDEEIHVNLEGGPKSGKNKAPKKGQAGLKGPKKKEKVTKLTQREGKKNGENNRMKKNTNFRTFLRNQKCTKGQLAKKAKSNEKLHLLVNNISKLVKNKIKEELSNKNISKDILNFEITKIKKKKNRSKDSLHNKRQDTTIILSNDSMSLSSETLNGTLETEGGLHKFGKERNENATSSASERGTRMHASTNSTDSSMDINSGKIGVEGTREMCETRYTNGPHIGNPPRQPNHKHSASEAFTGKKNSPLVGKEDYLYDDLMSTNFMLNNISLNNATCLGPNMIGIEQNFPPELALANMKGEEALHMNKLPMSYLNNMNLCHNADRNRTFHMGHNSFMEMNPLTGGKGGAFASKPLDCNHGNEEKKANINNIPINGDLKMNMGMLHNEVGGQMATHAYYGVNKGVENFNKPWDVNTISGDYQGVGSVPIGGMYYPPAANYVNSDNTIFQVEKLNSSFLFDINSLRPEANPPFYDHSFLNYNQMDRSSVKEGNEEYTLLSSEGIPNFCNEEKSTVGANSNSSHVPPPNCNKAISHSQPEIDDKPCEDNGTKDTKDTNDRNDRNECGKIKEYLRDNQKGGLKNTRRSKSVDLKKVGVRNSWTNDTLSEKPKMKTQIFNYSGNRKNGLRDMSTYADKVLEDMKSLIPSNVSSILEKSPRGGKVSSSVNELVPIKCNSNGKVNQSKNPNMGDEDKVGILGKENDKLLHLHKEGIIIKGNSVDANLDGTTKTSDLSHTSQDTLPSFSIKERERVNSMRKYNMEDSGYVRDINKSNDTKRNDYFLDGVNNEDVLLGKHYSRDGEQNKNFTSLEEKNSDEHGKVNTHLGSNMGDIAFSDIRDLPLNTFRLDNMLKEMHINSYANNGSNVLGNSIIPNPSFVENGLTYKNRTEEKHQFQSETRKSLSSFREALKKQGILG